MLLVLTFGAPVHSKNVRGYLLPVEGIVIVFEEDVRVRLGVHGDELSAEATAEGDVLPRGPARRALAVQRGAGRPVRHLRLCA